MNQALPKNGGLPDPEVFEDPVQYLRAVHLVVLERLRSFEAMLGEAAKSGVAKSFAESPEWSSFLLFFSTYLPVHERDEEEHLFPWVLEKLPHTGFQPKESPNRFLVEGHQVLQERAKELLHIWKEFTLGVDGKAFASAEEETHFLQASYDLIALLREHIATEDKLVYSKANDLLTPQERQLVMEGIIRNHVAVVASTMPEYDRPTSSMPVGGFTLGTFSGINEYEVTELTGNSPQTLEPIPEEDEPDEDDPDEDDPDEDDPDVPLEKVSGPSH